MSPSEVAFRSASSISAGEVNNDRGMDMLRIANAGNNRALVASLGFGLDGWIRSSGFALHKDCMLLMLAEDVAYLVASRSARPKVLMANGGTHRLILRLCPGVAGQQPFLNRCRSPTPIPATPAEAGWRRDRTMWGAPSLRALRVLTDSALLLCCRAHAGSRPGMKRRKILMVATRADATHTSASVHALGQG